MNDEALVVLYRGGDERAFEELWGRYQRTMQSVSRHFYAVGFDDQDIVQEAAAAFTIAIRKFDVSHGVPFGAFATNVVRARLKSFVRNQQALKRRPTGPVVSTDDDDGTGVEVAVDGDGVYGRVDFAIDVRNVLPLTEQAGDLDELMWRLDEMTPDAIVAEFYQPSATAVVSFSRDETKTMLLMIDEEGLSSIAARLNWSRKRVDNTIQRIRKKLLDVRPER